ncbi:hypothetical protein Pfo_004848, partial [Paulownia fortunei]
MSADNRLGKVKYIDLILMLIHKITCRAFIESAVFDCFYITPKTNNIPRPNITLRRIRLLILRKNKNKLIIKNCNMDNFI